MMVFDRHYFHTAGTMDLDLPAGQAKIEAIRGWEYRPKAAAVDVKAGGTQNVTITLSRLADLPARGWYSGDTHVHDLHQGRFGLSHGFNGAPWLNLLSAATRSSSPHPWPRTRRCCSSRRQ